MKTAKELFDKRYEFYRNMENKPAIPLEARDMILSLMDEYAKQYRMCALANEAICNQQCFTCGEDERLDAIPLSGVSNYGRQKCDVCNCCPSVIICTNKGTFCQEHAIY